MDLGDCYRLLGLRSGAAFADIKASYRRLARQYHPDINPDDSQAKEKFIALTEAYKLLLQVVSPEETDQKFSDSTAPRQTPQETPTPKPPNLSEIEEGLKWKTYEQLQVFLKQRRFPVAISLVEALAQRLPEDAEVRQWQAIAYQIWGRELIAQNQFPKAKIYLKKALKTDPNNKTLWLEVQRDFQILEEIF
ncbi:J domain-containing protein [Aetokthonos hydrillicola Thurmond2011]|uniref:J domain-containing protein n=1 Tax=Aetokthonos hydrillicola Thurmond2011 TaxID=2712845 RepID=A0AAP5IBF8_9CYAN|nr:J domain-containing protein [Aetokthonos hydrillicola]MBO3457851.1 DnaJ domain-containing protein [Aetokthonos hydrillicola CCALA 1050]MBW4587337.1 J domain-containing protein [Aetokthonos hydrillicola CCALA 1050]MDR9896638.1 J domain-containing protein [Aetokthonos hydrillicola Thurmond2011]